MNKIKIFDRPTIIKSNITYYYESEMCNPKVILIIENKTIDTKNINKNSLLQNYEIDYDNTNTSSTNNIMNYMNKMHAIYINNYKREHVEELSSKNFVSSNSNFAYHYFIDKKGHIYEGRPFNVKPFNLDIKDSDGNILSPAKQMFKDYLIILTEENTNQCDTTEETYTALKSLLHYLMNEYDFKEFYGYSELVRFDKNICDSPEEDIINYNNPGLFFKINELHSATDFITITDYSVSPFNIITYTYGKRVLKYIKPIYMNGNDVLILQKILYNIGLIQDYRNVNGQYNIITKNAVATFQKNNYIIPEFEYGTADSNTLKEIRNTIYKANNNYSKTINDNKNYYRVLEYNETNPMVGIDIEIVQKLLHEKIDYTLKITGIFDLKTDTAVRYFQALQYGGKQEMIDGKVGPITLQDLKNSDMKIFTENDGKLLPNKIGVPNDTIKLLQQALNVFLKKRNIIIPIDGLYNSLTINYIQKINEKQINRQIMDIDKYAIDSNGNYNEEYWKSPTNQRICYPEEYNWIIYHYLINDILGTLII